MRSLTSKWYHQDHIKIEWNLGKRCNLDCAYCPAEIHDNYSSHTPIKHLLDAVDSLKQLPKPVRLSLTGGEPCVHPNIEELIKHIVQSQHIKWLSITTNATRDEVWYLKQQGVSQYVFSLHFDNDIWVKSMNTICSVGKQFDRHILVNLMAHHEYMDRAKEAWKRFKFLNIPTNIRRIRWTEKHDWFDDMRYNIKDLDWILENESTVQPNCVDEHGQLYHANDIIKTHNNQFKGWTCNAGLESLMINWDGEVHRATCRVGGSLGNIYDHSFTPPEDPIVCTRDWCTCAADIPITKCK